MWWRRLAVAGAALALAVSSLSTPPARSQEASGFEVRQVRLASAIEAAIERQARDLGAARIGIYALDLATGKVLYERDADGGYNVASNTKIVTAAAALALLGPEFRLRTEALGASLEPDGTVKGDLYLRGRGNPGFGSDDMHKLALALAEAGVERVEGGIAIDASYFDRVDLPPHFDEQPDEHASFRAPIGATSVNFNMFALRIEPAPDGAGPARVRVEPTNDYVVVEGTVSTVRRGRTRLRIDTEVDAKKRILRLKLGGQIRRDAAPRLFRRRAPDSIAFVGTALRRALAEHGIEVGKKRRVVAAAVPDGARLLAVHESPPLAILLQGLGKYSNNYMAEMVLKVMGAELEAAGEPATWADGITAVERFLSERVGLEAGSFRYGNGSGLFESNRFSPKQLVAVLERAARDFRWGPDLVSSFALAGADGTLSSRLEGTAAERRIRAKTGTLATVSALSGYAAVDGRHRVAFSVLVNDIPLWHTSDARDLQDDVAKALVQYLASAE